MDKYFFREGVELKKIKPESVEVIFFHSKMQKLFL